MRPDGVVGGDLRMLEPADLFHADAPHDRHRRLIEHGGDRPQLGQPDAVERDVSCGRGRLGGIAVVPGGLGEPPADFHAARPRYAFWHRVEAGEADELTGGRDLKGPQTVALLVRTATRSRRRTRRSRARVSVEGKNRRVSGSPLSSANGSRSESRQRRSSSRSVMTVSNRLGAVISQASRIRGTCDPE